MNTIEDRLRDAYRAAAQTVRPESIRGAPGQPPRAARPGPRPASSARSRRNRIMVPLAAAAAVALIAVAATVVLPGTRTGQGPGGAAASGALPRFFLASPQTQTGEHTAVFSATTGRELALLTPPRPGWAISAAAATGNDRTFVLAAASGSGCGTTTLYRLRLTARGRPSSLAPLTAPRIKGSVTALAASADGRTIAYATEFCGATSDSPGAIGVVHAGTGQTRQWTWRPDPGQTIDSVTITANGRLIEYAASPTKITSSGSAQSLPVRTLRLLPADAPPGRAAQRSRAVVTMSRAAPAELFNSAAIAPDGRTLYFCTQRDSDHHGRSVMVLRGYNLATGASPVLHEFGLGIYCMLGVSGQHLLAGYGQRPAGYPATLFRYDASTGKSSPVPVPWQWGEVSSNIPW